MNAGGQAFPSLASNWKNNVQGMTLRDYFAAKAMLSIHGFHGVAANETAIEYREKVTDYIARTAYEMADAMLVAREAK